MALSFEAAKIAFKVFGELKLKNVMSFPPDLKNCDDWEQLDPIEEKTYGIDRKADYGWENLFFFKKNPSPEFIAKWNELKDSVPNTSFMSAYDKNPEYTIFGWI